MGATPVTLVPETAGGSLGNVGLDQSVPVLDSTGGRAYPDSYAHTLTRNGDGTIATDVFTDGVSTWTMTFGYTTGLVTSISRWVKT